MLEVALSILVLTGILLALTSLILVVRAWMVGTGRVQVEINQSKVVSALTGTSLLESLVLAGVAVPAVCGGRGTCGQCRVSVLEGGGPVRPSEQALLPRAELRDGVRLACQVTVRRDLRLRIPEDLLGVRTWHCRVRSSRCVTPFVKELILELPTGEPMNFRAGGYVLVECPPYRTVFRELDIATEFREEWDRLNLWRHQSGCGEPVQRAYSLANYPGEAGIVMLNVRIATPPPGSGPEVPAGVVSSYLFSRGEGDEVTVLGPYGTFLARDTGKEMVFLGGGAGMAPMRSHILDQLERLKTRRRIVFWYGARNRSELFYVDLFDRLAAQHQNFSWHTVLSEPQPGDHWTGLTGFVHAAAYDRYLADHPEPENCEYYVCGPPLMNEAVLRMLADLGVDRSEILLDDFGA